MSVHAVNPRPNVVVPASSPKYSIDASHVPDHFEVERVSIDEFRTTLRNGFKNAVGSRYTSPQNHDSVVLVFDNVEAELNNLGNIGRFISLRFRGRWLTPDNQLIAEFAGVAQPRNPTETGDRHLEDAVEVMFEKVISGLEQTADAASGSRGPVPGPKTRTGMTL